ncbi:hypothetical protein COW36_19200 [bacterium (Candidatus Blackallbacteria) CG17_big_fil_post_rev_8_21_14_2_50_48_46]|uniref:Radical SAM core domain-containing protein n=1 Tax=bacterium (Candidatus Blackallbacteria) CG17_big_fil_post_rev_8_21_14_2_50_48_46 TaxID=2014261 RepID=A0A2M7G044_9BACT|nr:MAG: hypothetical protein COW64_25270 [bacterium (Candidatus Blackallbacteria) CG18_big_fil_WC_8_21_14_2_50_49_26]PIW15052.1 MAG: hypothetical protein COW36_19200 [bacterium (Candidatus Blackallbacteria) CG17_big_fil_post_rev_8_21_14_2_50_48_46]PIW47625.1 MAG: hypothetical protein COW20_12120 [bacterium (Candidatus Blackallbacteria) CG13_big_fil_rev_8_21_14_2_50_49_14]
MYEQKPLLHARQAAHRPGQLRTLALDITPICNLKCSYCYAETFVKSKPIDLTVYKRLCDEAFEMGVFHYIFQGGEPILDPQRLEALIGYAHPESTYLNLISNGWAMTAERIDWLKDLQIDKITYSLDSGIPEEHDKIRGKGSHQRVLQAIEDTLKAGLLCGISTVVTRTSLYSEGFQMLYDFTLKKDIRFHIQIAEPVGKWDAQTDLLMRLEDSAFIEKLFHDSPTLSNGQKLIHRDIYGSLSSPNCPAATNFMSISANGECLPCNFLQYSLGRISEKPLSQMRSEILQSPWFSEKHESCICGEDAEFIEQFILPYAGQTKPLDAYSVFGLKALSPPSKPDEGRSS